ncbi:MAG: 3-deoxy-7-phosphoheptulonate synthase [Patescibacteria group bacterium]|nr:3-deoxy-7-phosphoheptulonate synthase [Patescibacteria group bacterium]
MIVTLKGWASRDAEAIERVEAVIREHELEVHEKRGTEYTVIAVIGVGDNVSACQIQLEAMDEVWKVQRISNPNKFVSRAYHTQNTAFPLNGHVLGGPEFIVMAGPCSIESEPQIMACAEVVADCGGHVLRGGAFKPRSSPYAFQGLGLDGLKLLRRAGDQFGLPVITEALAIEDLPLVEEWADIIQIGARNMQNFRLLEAVSRCKKPVMLKRGIASDVDEWLGSAEYIVRPGKTNVMLCERGIRTSDRTYTRNTLDIQAVPVLRELTHLPIIVDPSHAAGRRAYIPAMMRAAVAAGADGIIVEMHPDPPKAKSDGAQSLSFPEFRAAMTLLVPYLRLFAEERAVTLDPIVV